MLNGVIDRRGGGSRGAEAVRLLTRVRQIRDFLPDPVPDDALQAILTAARWTGSSQNRQPWRFLVIRDAGTRRRIAEIAAPQTTHAASAPLVIAVVMPGEGAVLDAYDEGRVTERILIAAELLGLGAGIGWVRSDVRPAVNDLLGVPEPSFVRTLVSIGRPTDDARQPRSKSGTARRPLAELVRQERFS